MNRYSHILSVSRSFTFAHGSLIGRPTAHSYATHSICQLTTVTTNAIHKLQIAVEQYRLEK